MLKNIVEITRIYKGKSGKMTSNVMSKEELEEILKTLEFTGEKE
jgi:hypothetical protein